MSSIDYVDDDDYDAGMWTDGADKHSLLWLPPFLMDGFSKENTIIGILIVDKRFVVVFVVVVSLLDQWGDDEVLCTSSRGTIRSNKTFN